MFSFIQLTAVIKEKIKDNEESNTYVGEYNEEKYLPVCLLIDQETKMLSV